MIIVQLVLNVMKDSMKSKITSVSRLIKLSKEIRSALSCSVQDTNLRELILNRVSVCDQNPLLPLRQAVAVLGVALRSTFTAGAV